eukprot:GILJ01008758.1.p1 GENE.GILJ01008758.1~~GILJ01008758.1.p1  ORF type:complete len:1249 (+),score=195.85 GILJ01008758.1:73-3819(+)
MMPSNSNGFPTAGILPKEETQADQVVKDGHDGTGVVVAIFDTGIDPGAPGLQRTPDGKVKIIDIVDCSGSGDVDTSTIRTAVDGAIEGLSGRRLVLNAAWTNPTGQWRVGLKRGFDLFPAGLVARLKQERRRTWDVQQREAIADIQNQLSAWDQANRNPTPEQKKAKQNLEVTLEQLNEMQKSFDDPGPIFDIVAFHDGEHFRVAVDTKEDGDLSSAKAMADYKVAHEFASFTSEDRMNYSIKVYDDGNVVSIVANAGSHGTHVAGIVGSYYPDEPELNGVAPGVQMISVKIGDSRLGSMETGTAMVRGLIATLENKCDLINMSYGEPTAVVNSGRFAQLATELVNKHNVIFVSSAGNEGPALSTAAAPGATTSAMIGVGASVSPPMMSAEYSMREQLPETQYTWSSRGPGYDGDLGVCISAPGGAIASVPNWTLQKNQLMNGTSMASPNACGGLALLLSALKQHGVKYTPQRVRRAIENTAREIPNVERFAQGRGLLQVKGALEYILKHNHIDNEDIRFEVDLPERKQARGLYLREPADATTVIETPVRVRVHFPENTDNEIKINFELMIRLESTAPWVNVASHLMLMNNGRQFDIRVDPTHLPEGVHYAEVLGYDSTNESRGPLFRLPITVVKPIFLQEHGVDDRLTVAFKDIKFTPGTIQRKFFAVPAGTTWADIKLRGHNIDSSRRYMLHCVYLSPHTAFRKTEIEHFIALSGDKHETKSIALDGAGTLEVCLAQWWASIGESNVDIEVSFHGLTANPSPIVLTASDGFGRAIVKNMLRAEELSVTAQLNTWRQFIRPKEATVRPLRAPRDLLPEGRLIYELVLEYPVSIKEDNVEVTPRFPALNDKLYEAEIEGQLFMLFDNNKRMMGVGDAWPEGTKLSKGEHVVRLQLRHDRVDLLEQHKQLLLALDRPVKSKEITLNVYDDMHAAITGGDKFKTRRLQRGERVAIYVGLPAADAIPSDAKQGDLFLGSIVYGKKVDNAAQSKRPRPPSLVYVVPPPANKPATTTAEPADTRTNKQKLEDAIRDLKVSHMSKITDLAEFQATFQELSKEYPSHLPLFSANLQFLDDEKQRKNRLNEVIGAADLVINQIDQTRLAQWFGTLHTGEEPEVIAAKKENEKKKEALVDALFRKGRALLELVQNDPQPDTIRSFDEHYQDLQKWVDPTEAKYCLVHIEREKRNGRLGTALKLLNKHASTAGGDLGLTQKQFFETRAALLGALGLGHWQQYEKRWNLIRFPPSYTLF